MTTIYKIPEALAGKYHGAGYALASITGGQLIDLIYLGSVLDDFDPDADLAAAIDDPRLAPAVRRLQVSGEVSIGMCSCWEFVVL